MNALAVNDLLRWASQRCPQGYRTTLEASNPTMRARCLQKLARLRHEADSGTERWEIEVGAPPAGIPDAVVLLWADQHQPEIARTYRHERGHPINGPVLLDQLRSLWWRWAVNTWARWTPTQRAEMEQLSDALEATGKTPHEAQVTAFLEVSADKQAAA